MGVYVCMCLCVYVYVCMCVCDVFACALGHLVCMYPCLLIQLVVRVTLYMCKRSCSYKHRDQLMKQEFYPELNKSRLFPEGMCVCMYICMYACMYTLCLIL